MPESSSQPLVSSISGACAPFRRARPVFLVALAFALLAGCGGKTKHDLYMEGLKIEGQAERGVCRAHFGDGSTMQTISGDRIQRCLRAVDEAIALYDQAEAMGLGDVDFKRVHARAKEHKLKHEQMLKQLRVMEHERLPSSQ